MSDSGSGFGLEDPKRSTAGRDSLRFITAVNDVGTSLLDSKALKKSLLYDLKQHSFSH